MKRIYKYPTGAEVPEGAIYLYSCKNGDMPRTVDYPPNYQYVWHYFLVEVKE